MREWYNWASDGLSATTKGYINAGRYNDPRQEADTTRKMTRVVEEEPQKMAGDKLVRQVSEAPTKEAAMDTAKESGAIMALLSAIPSNIRALGRVESKRHFANIAQKMFETGQQMLKDPNLSEQDKGKAELLATNGALGVLAAQTIMKVKIEDHIADAVNNFAKKAGAVCLAVATAVAAVVALAAKEIGKLWDKTKPARDKIKQTLQDMAKKIAEVTKPAREAMKAIAKKAGIKMEEFGQYMAEKAHAAGTAISKKAQAAGKAISEKAHQAGKYLASTAPGKKIIKAGRDVRGKMNAVTAAASAAIGAKLVAKGVQMQEEHAKHEKAIKTMEKFSTPEMQERLRKHLPQANALTEVAKLRRELKKQKVSLETRQQAAPYAAGAKPRDRSQGK